MVHARGFLATLFVFHGGFPYGMMIGIGAVCWVLLLRVIVRWRWRHGMICWGWWGWCCRLVDGCRWIIQLLIPRSYGRNCVNFLLILVIPSTERMLLCRVTCPTERLIKKSLVVFNLLGLETVLKALSILDQVGK